MAEEKKDDIVNPNDKVEGKEGEVKVSITLDKEDEDVLATDETTVPPTIPDVKKDPKKEQDNIGPDSPRFNQIYGKLKGQERVNEALVKKLEEKDDLFASVQEHQKKLTEAILKIEQGRESREVKKEQGTVLDSLNTTAKELGKSIAVAYDEGKVDEAMRLNDQLVETKVAIAQAKAAPKIEQKNNEAKPVKVDDNSTPENTKAVAKIQGGHKWLGDNKEMTEMAVNLDNAFRVDPAYKDVPLEERYEDVAQLVEERFGMSKSEESNDEGTEQKRQFAAVEEGSDGFSQGGGTSREVVLSAEQRNIARSMDISEEDYAKQLYMIAGQRGVTK